MEEYVFSSDLLNKYSQLTPWVQALTGLTVGATVIGVAYFIKEIVSLIMNPFSNAMMNCKIYSKTAMSQRSCVPVGANSYKGALYKDKWQDKYYRDT